MKITIIDPPSGWKFGFPKPIPEEVKGGAKRFSAWLVEQGYPRDNIELALKYSRYWETDSDDWPADDD